MHALLKGLGIRTMCIDSLHIEGLDFNDLDIGSSMTPMFRAYVNTGCAQDRPRLATALSIHTHLRPGKGETGESRTRSPTSSPIPSPVRCPPLRHWLHARSFHSARPFIHLRTTILDGHGQREARPPPSTR